VNSVLRGPTRSEGAVDFLGKVAAEHNTDIAAVEEEFIRTMRPTSLIRRFAESEEVANLVVFLCGEGASGNYRHFTASRWRRGAQHRLRRPAAWR
jgi:NAD(P)-dependent dehydrogenase (short-subunit alcohol dehydrogenase family)